MNQATDLEGSIALVTGGGRGIGRSIALGLARSGADVCVLARTKTQIDEVVEEIQGLGQRGLAICADVTNPRSVEQAVAEFSGQFGELDVLVNNAGGATDRSGMLDSSTDDWLGAVRLNIDSVFLVSRTFVPLMSNGNGGKIINIGSGMGHGPGAANSSYRVGKAGS